MLFALIFAVLFVFPSEELQKFMKHGSGMQEYVFVKTTECKTGLRRSGYAVAPEGSVTLKQVNADGTIPTSVCKD